MYSMYRLLLFYVFLTYRLYHYKEKWFAQYPFLRQCSENLAHLKDYWLATLQQRYREPTSNNWMCMCLLVSIPTDSIYKEISSRSLFVENDWAAVFEKEYNQFLSCFLKSTQAKEGMILLKKEDSMICRSFFAVSDIQWNLFDYVSDSPEKVIVKLLDITYTHPLMSNEIYIELDDSIYRKDNMILSPLFVRRYLEYQKEPFVFDDQYILNIMDNHIRSLEMTSRQYMVIQENDYTICNIVEKEIQSKTI